MQWILTLRLYVCHVKLDFSVILGFASSETSSERDLLILIYPQHVHRIILISWVNFLKLSHESYFSKSCLKENILIVSSSITKLKSFHKFWSFMEITSSLVWNSFCNSSYPAFALQISNMHTKLTAYMLLNILKISSISYIKPFPLISWWVFIAFFNQASQILERKKVFIWLQKP